MEAEWPISFIRRRRFPLRGNILAGDLWQSFFLRETGPRHSAMPFLRYRNGSDSQSRNGSENGQMVTPETGVLSDSEMGLLSILSLGAAYATDTAPVALPYIRSPQGSA